MNNHIEQSFTKSPIMTWEEAVIWLRNQPEQIDLAKACYYDDPIEEAAWRFAESDEFAAVLRLSHCLKNSNVLDIGSGRGIAAFAFASRGHRVTALEPDPSDLVGHGAIQRLNAVCGTRIRITDSSAEAIDSAKDQFDLVYCRAAFHHAKSLTKLCREVQRVLKPGGIFIATREHVISRDSDLDAFLKAHPLHHLYGGEMAYRLETYLDAITGAGLKVSKVLGPRQSVINAFPKSEEALEAELSGWLKRKLGMPGRLLSKSSSLRREVAAWLDSKDHQPGRLYSFVAFKAKKT
jgi:SAM-dependent methyltransferase